MATTRTNRFHSVAETVPPHPQPRHKAMARACRHWPSTRAPNGSVNDLLIRMNDVLEMFVAEPDVCVESRLARVEALAEETRDDTLSPSTSVAPVKATTGGTKWPKLAPTGFAITAKQRILDLHHEIKHFKEYIDTSPSTRALNQNVDDLVNNLSSLPRPIEACPTHVEGQTSN